MEKAKKAKTIDEKAKKAETIDEKAKKAETIDEKAKKAETIEGKAMMDKVKKIVEKIILLYKTQKYTQPKIAEEIGVSKEFVSKVTQMYNYKHRVKGVEPLNMVIDYEYLTKFYIEHEKQ